MTLYIWRAKFIINTLETTTFLSNSTLTSRLKIPSFDWFVLTGGYGNYLLAMSERIAKQSTDTLDIKKLSLGWMIGYLFVVSFLRLFSVVPLRKVYRIFVHFRKIQVALMGNKRKEKKRITLEISSSNTRKLCRSCYFSTMIRFMVVSDHDHRLQTDVSEWYCNCSSYQQLPYSSRSQASKVRQCET